MIKGEDRLKGSVTIGRKVRMPGYGSLSLEYTEEFFEDVATHEEIADKLVGKVRAKLTEWDVAR